MNTLVDDRKQVCIEIAKQLGGFNHLTMMIGAKDFMYDNRDLSFKFMRSGADKLNYVKISLNESDLYDIEFWNLGRVNFNKVKTIEMVFADQLIPLFEENTGLTLSRPIVFRVN